MPYDFAEQLFKSTTLGLRVIVAPSEVAPSSSPIRRGSRRNRMLMLWPPPGPHKLTRRPTRPIRRNSLR
jgi:hypothetical protein